ncbi:hypothetical protein [Tautonia sociabilis]|uniref:hypothetical protein n=1 Tax=Tautonia sociabilis TaxID=2080755 RepID=UPI0018F3D895|nr:hypothetical protein [Tautonia sociabilis]
MNASRTLALALGIAAILSAPVLAQRPGAPGQGPRQGRFGPGMGMGMGMGGLIQPLMAPPVQQELKLSDDQISEIQAIAEEQRGSMRGLFQELGDLDPEARREKMQSILQEREDATRAKLKEVLDEGQLARVEQIHLQMQGIDAFSSPEVREKLTLSEDQVAKIDEVIASYRDEARTIMENARQAEQPGAVMRDLMALRSSSVEKAMATLTDEQKATWKEMTGEPFEMPFGGGFGRGGRGGRGGRPGGPPPSQD